VLRIAFRRFVRAHQSSHLERSTPSQYALRILTILEPLRYATYPLVHEVLGDFIPALVRQLLCFYFVPMRELLDVLLQHLGQGYWDS
jgi:hypothetical protein